MPTKRQLQKTRIADHYLGCNTENEYGMNVPPSKTQEFTGEVVGKIVFDPEHKDLKVIPKNSK